MRYSIGTQNKYIKQELSSLLSRSFLLSSGAVNVGSLGFCCTFDYFMPLLAIYFPLLSPSPLPVSHTIISVSVLQTVVMARRIVLPNAWITNVFCDCLFVFRLSHCCVNMSHRRFLLCFSAILSNLLKLDTSFSGHFSPSFLR